MNLEGKTALITGASRGIGRAVVLELAKNGANVLLNFHGSFDRAEAVKKEIEKCGKRAWLYRCDVSDYSACEKMFRDIFEQHSGLDILVNNAGITRDDLLIRMSEEAFDSVIDTNLKGTFHCMRFASRQMMKQRFGRIINLSSVVGVVGNAGQANYAASKAGVIGLTKSAAKELASRNITVNAIAPGFIETDMTAILPEKIREQTLSQIPAGKFGKAEDVAHAAVFLASEEAGYITGQVLHVDGGMVM